MEGDDEFFVISWRPGVALRIIGGLGSDAINIGGDVVEDIIVRELEGVSASVEHLVKALNDLGYDGLIAPGLDLNVASPKEGVVVITESDGFTSVREGGPVDTDSYTVKLAAAPIGTVFVTVSAARSNQQERDGAPAGDTMLVSTTLASFFRPIVLNGAPVLVPKRAVVLAFDATNWNVAQTVFVRAVDDLRSEGDRVVTINHSTIAPLAADKPVFDHVAARNVEVTIRDNDTPGLVITQVQPGTSIEDRRTVVLEGDTITGLADEYLVELAKPPLVGTVTIRLTLSDAEVELASLDSRFDSVAKTITFTAANWNAPVRIVTTARQDFRREDPGNTTITHRVDTTVPDADTTYTFADQRVDVEALDDDTPGVLLYETGGQTIVIKGDTTSGPGPGDTYTLRLTKQPNGNVTIALLTDGQTDVKTINGVPVTLVSVGGLVAAPLFLGNVTFSGTTITRALGSELGSFLLEGFAAGQLLRITGGTPNDNPSGGYVITGVTHTAITLSGVVLTGGTFTATSLARVQRQWTYTGSVAFDPATNRLTRTDGSGWLADGFLEGQTIRISGGLNAGDYKINTIRGLNTTKDETLELTLKPGHVITSAGTAIVTVERLAPVVTFTPSNFYDDVEIELVADPWLVLPASRDNVKFFPVQTHLLSKMRGPISVEGGETGADRSLVTAVKLPGEADAPLFNVGPQLPENTQIDVLNVFNDSSQEDGVGALDATHLSGFGMSGDLLFDATDFGEPVNFPGGISFGTITFDPITRTFVTDGSRTTVEVLNIMLGSGNDRLTITGTLIPGPDRRTGIVADHGGLTLVHGAGNSLLEITGGMTFGSSSITRGDGLNWVDDGYRVGQQIAISGLTGLWTIASLAGATLNVTGAVLASGAAGTRTVAVHDPKTGSTRIGGDTVTISGGAGPNSPLVVYGDTSQDGTWYSGSPFDSNDGLDLGPKPADQAGTEDDRFVFPKANPFRYHGHDVIDARLLFAGAAAGSLPSVGFTAYGGRGDDTIYGSQTGDHLAGGSGDDYVEGQRGIDHIYGDSGVNVDIISRALSIPVVNASVSPVADPLLAGKDTLHGEGPGSVAGAVGDNDDVIFGDHGAVTQDVADPNLPSPKPQKIQTTLRILRIDSQSLQNGADDAIFGSQGLDILIGGAGSDSIDGDEEDDLIFGDNVELRHRVVYPANFSNVGTVDITNPRFETLIGTLIYSRTDQSASAGVPVPFADTSGELLIDGTPRNYRDPDAVPYWAEYIVENLFHTFAIEAGTSHVGTFGNDYIAGGVGHDVLFGQLGNDVLQGDGGIEGKVYGGDPVLAFRTPGGPTDPIGPLTIRPSFEAASDGDDYVEGGGGTDLIFGGLGQDDLIGGSSSLFTLDLRTERPDGADLIFGGAGTQADRDDDDRALGTSEAQRHARDADAIVSDNGNIHRLVGINHVDVGATAKFLTFVYDNYGTLRIVVRGVHLLDYTAGGPDFRPDLFGTGQVVGCGADIGGADEVHGETGDDTVYTGCGNDVLYGDADDDDLIGGWGHDWISGGTGQDGVLGDDGRIFTSRNNTTVGEPLYGIAPLLASDPDTRNSNGNVINEFIYTPGEVQTATINVAGMLNKAVDITPFNLTPNAGGADEPLFSAREADDIIYGGLGDDFLHGASGNDAISGAEALNGSFGQREDAAGNVVGIVRSDWTRPYNGGDMLRFGEDVPSSHTHFNNGVRQGEFALYDEFDPRRAVLLNDDGSAAKIGSGWQWLLNFDHLDGYDTPLGCVQPTNQGCALMASVKTDGNDVIFGDLGNDWLVGGTGNDTVWGGWGNDLLNVDDVMTVAGDGTFGDGNPKKIQPSPNDTPDTHPTYEDRAYGGAGLDILMGNTGGDRLIDWVGEFNSYIVPFAPFGIATISRQVPPSLFEFLYALSRAQGADPTRATDTGNSAVRNGEPDGELGLVTQQDHGLWQKQTGGPTDPQPGNVPGGKRDVLRSADFNDGSTAAFAADSGLWTASGGTLRVSAASTNGDAVAVWYHDEYLPIYYELSANVLTTKPTGGWNANAYLIFDYFSPTDFKFAGIDVSTNKLVLGHRTSSGWVTDAQQSVPGSVVADKNYLMFVGVNGTAVTVAIDGKKAFTYNFQPRILSGETVALNKGMLGIGSNNARGVYDNVSLQILPPQITLDETETFTDGVGQRFTGSEAGTWSVSGGRASGTAPTGGIAYDDVALGLGRGLQSDAYLEISATLRASTGGSGGIIFDQYSATDYKYVALDVASGKIVIGHSSPRGGATVDVSVTKPLLANTDYAVGLTIKGLTISVTLNNGFVVTYAFNGVLVDGNFGLFSQRGTTSFDQIRIRTNDTAFPASTGTTQTMTLDPGSEAPAADPAALDEPTLALLVESGKAYWTTTLGSGDPRLTIFDGLKFSLDDLPGLTLGLAEGTTITLDTNAGGYGWFVEGVEELNGRVDAETVVEHELGHVLGLEHEHADEHEVMGETIALIDPALGPSSTSTLTDTAEGSISGQLFNDLNADSVKYPGEPGLDRWSIQLFDGADLYLASTLTDVDGIFGFTDLANPSWFRRTGSTSARPWSSLIRSSSQGQRALSTPTFATWRFRLRTS